MAIFNLKIFSDTAHHTDIDRILGVNGNKNVPNLWIYELIEKDQDPHIYFIEIFTGLLKEKFQKLESIGVGRDNISIWAIYDYEGQFNVEYLPSDLRLLGEVGVTFCISCWESSN